MEPVFEDFTAVLLKHEPSRKIVRWWARLL